MFTKYKWQRNHTLIEGRGKSKGMSKRLRKSLYPRFNFKTCFKERSTSDVTGNRRKALNVGKSMERSIENGMLPSFAKWCNDNGMVIVGTQVVVVDVESTTATPIDVVLQNRETKNYVALEIKTGYTYRDDACTNTFVQPYSNIPFTVRRCHELQAYYGKYLMEQTYPGIIVTAGLLYVNNDGIEFTDESKFHSGVMDPVRMSMVLSSWRRICGAKRRRSAKKRATRKRHKT